MSSQKLNVFFRYYTSIAIFIFFSLALTLPSGYHYGAALLAIAGLICIFFKKFWAGLENDDKKIIFVLLFFVFVWYLEIIITGQRSREFDKPSRFILAALALLFLLKYPPKAASLWMGVGLGAISTGGLAAWQKIIVGMERATGFTQTIQFGNLSMLLGLLCLAGLGWAFSQPRRVFWILLFVIGFFCGFLGSILSGSRGGWIGLPFVFVVLYQCYRPWINTKALIYILLAIFVLIAGVYLAPQTGVKVRIDQAVHDIENYNSGSTHTSLGTRFEFWKGSLLIIKENPFRILGEPEFERKLESMQDDGLINPAFIGHAHNEYLDVTAKRGVLGLVALLALYLVPLKLFISRSKDASLSMRSFSAAGAVLCVAYVDFGLTQVFLSHNSGVMIFGFSLVIIWSIMRFCNDPRDNCSGSISGGNMP